MGPIIGQGSNERKRIMSWTKFRGIPNTETSVTRTRTQARRSNEPDISPALTERHRNSDGAGGGVRHPVGLAPGIRERQGTMMETAVTVLNRRHPRIRGGRGPKVLTEVINHRRSIEISTPSSGSSNETAAPIPGPRGQRQFQGKETIEIGKGREARTVLDSAVGTLDQK